MAQAANPYLNLQPALHPVYARVLCTEMVSRGFTHEALFSGTRLDWPTLQNSNEFLTFEQMRRLILRALQLSHCPWLGLEVGLKTQASAHGMIGAAMIASPSLPQAMLLLQRFAGLRQNLAELNLEQEHGFAVCLTERVDLGDVREYLYGQLLGGLSQLLTALTGMELPSKLRIEWPFRRPQWAEQYDRIAAHNSFDHKKLRVFMAPEALESPSLAADEEALQRLLRDCEMQLKRIEQGGSLSNQIRKKLQKEQDRMPTLVEMAQRYNLTERTFIRHLKNEGQSYQKLLDEVRMERACWLLEQTDMTIQEVSNELKFEDDSNFSRTFRRWMNVTPSAYRKRQSRKDRN